MKNILTGLFLLFATFTLGQGVTFKDGKLVSGNKDSAATTGQQVQLNSDTSGKKGLAKIEGNFYFWDDYWKKAGSDFDNSISNLVNYYTKTIVDGFLASKINVNDTGLVVATKEYLSNYAYSKIYSDLNFQQKENQRLSSTSNVNFNNITTNGTVNFLDAGGGIGVHVLQPYNVGHNHDVFIDQNGARIFFSDGNDDIAEFGRGGSGGAFVRGGGGLITFGGNGSSDYNVYASELGSLSGVSSNIQGQLNSKQSFDQSLNTTNNVHFQNVSNYYSYFDENGNGSSASYDLGNGSLVFHSINVDNSGSYILNDNANTYLGLGYLNMNGYIYDTDNLFGNATGGGEISMFNNQGVVNLNPSNGLYFTNGLEIFIRPDGSNNLLQSTNENAGNFLVNVYAPAFYGDLNGTASYATNSNQSDNLGTFSDNGNYLTSNSNQRGITTPTWAINPNGTASFSYDAVTIGGSGNIVANYFVKSGYNANELLLSDGTVAVAGSGITIDNGVISGGGVNTFNQDLNTTNDVHFNNIYLKSGDFTFVSLELSNGLTNNSYDYDGNITASSRFSTSATTFSDNNGVSTQYYSTGININNYSDYIYINPNGVTSNMWAISKYGAASFANGNAAINEDGSVSFASGSFYSDVSGNVYASTFYGNLQGSAEYASNCYSASYSDVAYSLNNVWFNDGDYLQSGSQSKGILTTNWSILPSGYNTLNRSSVYDAQFITTTSAPSSSTATGTKGEVRFSGLFKYECIAANTWVRTAVTLTF